MVWLPVLTPLIGGVAILALRRQQTAARMTSVAAMVATVVAAAIAAASQSVGEWTWGGGLDLAVSVTGFGRVMVILVPVVAAVVIGFAATNSEGDRAIVKLLVVLTWFVAAMELLVIAADFLTLLIGWELVGAASWVLIGHEWRDPDRPRSAREAFVTTRFGDLGLYVAAGAVFASTGSLLYTDLATASPGWLAIVAGGLVLAAAAKSAQVPFSPWLFSAMAGPTPVSALLHSATMVAAGAYVLIRLEPTLSAVNWFAPVVVGIGLVTALAGGMVALAQQDLKKALAGSTSAQYGLMLVAVGAGFTAAAAGQLTAHALFKSLLFLAAGVALHARGTLDLSKLRLGSALPRVAVLFGIGALALAAVPPLGAAFTKEAVLAGAFQAGIWVGLGTATAGLLSTVYAGRLHMLAYGPGPSGEIHGSPRRGEVAALGVLAALTLVLGVLWLPGGDAILERASGGAILAPTLAETALAWTLLAIGLVVVAVAWRSRRLVTLGLPSRLREFIAGWWGLPGAARVLIIEPVSRLGKLLFVADTKVMARLADAVAGFGEGMSRFLRQVVDRSIDAIVWGIGRGTVRGAGISRLVDDRGVDRSVEGLASGIGLAGKESRRFQTGMSYHYYTMMMIGLVVAIAVAAFWR
ncbi:MAG: NADH-quinone oxidoreductase subunit L [Acidimicrobiia bacterium]|nr:MAG: NADH-quinone oxidoreductase subunit L [Acidimicrobiia bacterium]